MTVKPPPEIIGTQANIKNVKSSALRENTPIHRSTTSKIKISASSVSKIITKI